MNSKYHDRQNVRDSFEQRTSKNVHEAVLRVPELYEITELRWTTKKGGRYSNVSLHYPLVGKLKLKDTCPFGGNVERTCLSGY